MAWVFAKEEESALSRSGTPIVAAIRRLCLERADQPDRRQQQRPGRDVIAAIRGRWARRERSRPLGSGLIHTRQSLLL
jgi:hypothetical protein